MNKKPLSNALHIGGTLEGALSGNYKLSATQVIQEAAKLTQANFWQFFPAILLFVLINIMILLFFLTLFTGSFFDFFDALIGKKEMTADLSTAGQLATFMCSVLAAPFYAGISLMGLSHAIGFKTKFRHIFKGLNYAMPVVIAVSLTSFIQYVASQIMPLLGMFIGATFSMVLLLICEKKLTVSMAIMVSFRAVLKKILPLSIIFIIVGFAFILSYATAGIALIWTLPFMLNVKGILYRDMFGVGIEVTVSQQDDDDSSNNSEVFDA